VARRGRFLRSAWLLYLSLCLPLLLMALAPLRQSIEYIADPAKYLLELSGTAAVALLVVAMAVTPLRQLFPSASLVRALAFRRRQIGVGVFFYASLHALLYLPYAGGLAGFLVEWTKAFILSGLAAFLLLAVLALTSSNFAVRRLGGRRWKQLHRLTYVAAALVAYHQLAQEKTGYQESLLFFGPLLLLELLRLSGLARKIGGRFGSA